MAITDISISEELETGAPSIKYRGNEGPKSPEEERMMMVDDVLDEAYEQYIYDLLEQRPDATPMSKEEFRRMVIMEGMIGGGNPLPEDPTKPVNPFQPKPIGPVLPDKRQMAAYGGIMGVDGRKQYGIGSYFQKLKDKVVDDISPHEIKENPEKARDLYDAVRKNIFIKDASGRDMAWVESVCKAYKPDIVLLDMGDKFARTGGFARPDEALKANAVHARQIAKQHECAVFYMSQLSAEAEGKVVLNQAMMEGSRTGKAAEADLMLMISKNPTVEGQEEEDNQRHINVVKNKLSGWHGIVHTDLEYKIARYVA